MHIKQVYKRQTLFRHLHTDLVWLLTVTRPVSAALLLVAFSNLPI